MLRNFTFFILLTGVSALPAASAAVPKTPPPASVSARTVQAADLSDILSYPARVSPKVTTVVLAESDGVVAEVRAPLGQDVQAKERLIKIQHTDPIYRYAPVWVSSPVNGVVSSVEVNQGSYVTRGQKLATVTDPSQVRVTVEVPAADLAQVSKGLVGEFRLPGRDAMVPVIVQGVSPFVDPSTGTASVELEIRPESAAIAAAAGNPGMPAPASSGISSLATRPEGVPQAALAAGLIGQVTFLVNQRKGISVPEQSVVYRGKETFVRVLRDGKAYKVAVALGRRIRDRFEIVNGLENGATIIERSSRFLSDGEEVQVQGNGDAAK